MKKTSDNALKLLAAWAVNLAEQPGQRKQPSDVKPDRKRNCRPASSRQRRAA